MTTLEKKAENANEIKEKFQEYLIDDDGTRTPEQRINFLEIMLEKVIYHINT